MKARLHLKIIALFSYLIPRRFRSDWTEEWSAELQHRESRPDRDLIRPSLGAFWDALAMQSRRLEEDFWQDVRYGVRTFASSKGVTAAVVLSLALGIGANTALFSLIDPVLLKKLPVRNSDELLLLQWVSTALDKSSIPSTSNESLHNDPIAKTQTGGAFSHLVFERFRDHARPLADVFAFSRIREKANLVVDDQAETVTGQWVSGGYFAGLGVAASVGRVIVDSDDHKASAPVALVSHRYWSRRFALDPGVVGKAIKVGGKSFTVVGVTPPGFDGTLQVDDAPDIYIPISFEPSIAGSEGRLDQPDYWWVWIMARPKTGVSSSRLRDELEPVLQQAAFEGLQTALAAKRQVSPVPASEREPPLLNVVSGSRGLNDNRETYGPPLLMLSVLSGLVLLIACINVANLLLSRATTRQQEMAVRFAMGAGRLRLVRQLLTESLLLAVCGGACGLVAAYYGKSLLLRWGPWNPSASGLASSLDLRVLVFTAGLTLLASVVSGVVPAIAATRRGLNATMKEHARTVSRSSRIGKILLAGQAAMSVMLLVGSGLFVGTVYNLRNVVVAEDPSHLLEFTVDAGRSGYGRNETVSLADRILDQLRAVQGVNSATVSGFFGANPIGPVYRRAVGPGFFKTMGIPLVEGRDLDPSDNGSARKVVVVNEAFVRRFFPNSNPLGKDADGVIVGVARNADYAQLRKEVWPATYAPYSQQGGMRFMDTMTFQIRTLGDPMELLPSIRAAVRKVNPQIALSDVSTLAEQIDRLLATENMFARLSTLFGGIALLLTSIGLFGILSYSVARRTKEFGVRLAMGARPRYVIRLVMQDGLTLVAVGIGIGIGGALVASRYVGSLLFGLVPSNPFVIVVAVAVVATVSVVACLAPARRAARVVPIDALRYE